MRTNRLMIEAVACSSLQTAGQHISDRGSDQCSAQCRGHPGRQSGLFFQICSWYGHQFEHQYHAINQGAQRILVKGDKVLCLLRLGVLLLDSVGRGSPAHLFL